MYLGEDTYGLKPIWDGVFEIYQAIVKVCEAHKLRYYVTDGVALGAIRHKGFIPWDDDFDMSMPREDYEKFISIADKELPEYFKVVTWHNTPEYNWLFAKVQDSRREKVEAVEKAYGKMLSGGIFVDILPIDGDSDCRFFRYINDKCFRFMRVLWRFQCDKFSHQTRKGRICWLMGMALTPLLPMLWGRARLLECLEKTAKNTDDTRLTCRKCSNVSYRRPPIPRNVWGNGRVVPYGDGFVKVPEKVEDYLRNEYGDYMKLPPEQKRHPGHQYSWRCPWWLGPTISEDIVRHK